MESELGRQSRWGNLPPDLILSIVGLVALPDVVRARGVCRQWATVLRKPCSLPAAVATFPFLILSSEHGEQSESCNLLSLPESCCYCVSPLPEIRNRRFIGSNGNWLVTLNLALEPRLLNPFTREEAPLPSLMDIPDPEYKCMCVPLDLNYISTWVGFYYPSHLDEAQQSSSIPYPINLFRDLCIRKIVPSSDNGPPTVIVVAYGFHRDVRLALARPGDSAWTLVPLPLSVNKDGISDVVHNAKDGRFYAVSRREVVLAFHPDNPEHVTIISKRRPYSCDEKRYLVFSSDDLLMVERYPDVFWVYKIDMQGEEGDLTFPSLTHMEHLNGKCLMLGSNHSVSLSPEQVPGLKGNCIYFTDDYPDDLSQHYRDHLVMSASLTWSFALLIGFLPIIPAIPGHHLFASKAPATCTTSQNPEMIRGICNSSLSAMSHKHNF
ncbi:putative F-box protein [Platanthera guangdongensis]|uniref:F-box protein n=1 Tax=Platanthera guangdongensis TaxID=2320717 RepID=A0ABR2MIF5_9ASPA